MDMKSFGSLFDLSTSSSVAVLDGGCVGFLIALGHGSEYENHNYQWFSRRLVNFVYVDRVVVSSTCHGVGIGSLLYSRLLAATQQAGTRFIAAEIDVDPPNQASLRFHEKMGFIEIGRRDLASGKQVSMQAFRVDELV